MVAISFIGLAVMLGLLVHVTGMSLWIAVGVFFGACALAGLARVISSWA